ncbi:ImcF-related family protein [Pseudomonas akapageensis]|uniref:ImcF-related family protein n=1 Tax=Pseudomonas akapageensis TaxID=2609961 RepID=UPI001409E3F1|nr:ImcF-related family protein [Pseudomonas akapageensis]
MRFRRSVGVGGVLFGGLLLTAMVLGALVWFHPEWLGMAAGSARQTSWLSVIAATTSVVVIFLGGYRLLWQQQGLSTYRRQGADEGLQPRQVSLPPPSEARTAQKFAALDAHLRHRYGYFWRRKVRVLLVVGEPTQIEAIVPGLTEARPWLEGQDTVLLWGGNVQTKPDASLLALWRQLCRWRGMDGVVWTLNKAQSADSAKMGKGVRGLQDLAFELGWQMPLHLWQVCDSAWSQHTRTTQAVGCSLPARCTEQDLQSHLGQLLDPLRSMGLEQMQVDMGHDFLLRLSRDLQVEGIARWRQAVSPLLGQFARGVPLRGLWFSLALPAPEPKVNGEAEHLWLRDPAWGGVLGDHSATARRVGWSAPRIGYALMLGLAAVWGAGLLLSFASNRAQIADLQTSLATLQQAEPGEAQRLALSEWVLQLGRLDYRAEHGAPWYQRFGLNQNRALLEALWPHYVEVTHRLLRDPAATQLTAQLNALIKLPPDSPERTRRSREAYDQLKAYLMLANPEKADAAFLVNVLGQAEPDLWQFYAEQLPAHPQWRLEADPMLVAQARLVLLGQLGQRNAEASLYQQVLDSSASHYPALRLQQMLGDNGGMALFSTTASVPGVFTRQAWEGQVRQAIDKIAAARREEVDWVLSDNPASLAVELSPDVLRERLTARYFQDYSGAWLDFLGSLRWHPADSLGDVIDQLTLMSDVRQSPLIALMNTLAYQGQAGSRRQALADSLLQSAQQLIAQDKQPVIDQQVQGPSGPLDATFGPLLTLLGSASEDKTGNDSLSLQAFLTQVTRVRLTLQQISTAPDPQAMTQALAQTVFQGKNVDLTETQAYGNLLAASLGAEWGGIGQTLFVQPLEQAWQRVLQPSAASLNRQWQRAIVSHWQSAFASRYPFAATPSDASLPMLGQMIRADSGRIEQFLREQLGGVLRKEGDRWVADPRHSQGLRFNPQFLTAINQLSHLADVLYTDGGMGLSFELRGKPVRDVVETVFVLNGEKHHYFNQKESWQRFAWPGRSDRPGVSLTWTSVRTGARLFGDYEGTWGLIRLLEQAQVTPLDDADSRYRLVLKAPDGLGLTWHLRTELGAGPLALLKLRGFKLPSQIFLAQSGADGH